MAKGYWTHSKSEKKYFANTMTLIDKFCKEHGVEHIENGGSYRFTLNGKQYIITNSVLPKELRKKGVTYFFASQLRLMDIYNDLVCGKELDAHGKRIGGDEFDDWLD